MRNRTNITSTMTALLAVLLLATGSLCLAAPAENAKPAKSGTQGGSTAAPAKAATPDLQGKREMVRKQQEQRITQDKRTAGAKALQAQRKKVHDAKQAVKQSVPPTTETK